MGWTERIQSNNLDILNIQMNTTVAPVTRIARRRALPGREKEYEATIREMFAAMHPMSGFLGADLIPPERPGDDYQVVVRFACEAALQLWDESAERRRFHARLTGLTETEPAYRTLTGLEAWFTPPVVPPSLHPPRGRMTIVTWLGIFPTVSLYLWLVGPLLADLPYLLRTAILTGLVVPTMTYLLMPRLTRLLKGWLNPSKR